MKIELHVPVEQYGFVSATFDLEKVNNTEIREVYDGIKAAFNSGEGLPNGEWNRIVDSCLNKTLKLTPTEWETMSPQQQFFLNEIKKSRNRKPM